MQKQQLKDQTNEFRQICSELRNVCLSFKMFLNAPVPVEPRKCFELIKHILIIILKLIKNSPSQQEYFKQELAYIQQQDISSEELPTISLIQESMIQYNLEKLLQEAEKQIRLHIQKENQLQIKIDQLNQKKPELSEIKNEQINKYLKENNMLQQRIKKLEQQNHQLKKQTPAYHVDLKPEEKINSPQEQLNTIENKADPQIRDIKKMLMKRDKEIEIIRSGYEGLQKHLQNINSTLPLIKSKNSLQRLKEPQSETQVNQFFNANQLISQKSKRSLNKSMDFQSLSKNQENLEITGKPEFPIWNKYQHQFKIKPTGQTIRKLFNF